MRMIALLLMVPSLALGQGVAKVIPTRTQFLKQSTSLSTATAATSPWALDQATVSTQSGAPDGIGSWAQVAGTNASGAIYQQVTGGVFSPVITASTWMRKASGTGYAGIESGQAGNTITSCVCSRSDGGACTAISARIAGYCYGEIADLGVAPVRLAITYTVAAPTASGFVFLYSGKIGTSVGTTQFWGAQYENGYGASPLIKTTTVRRTRVSGK